MATLQMGEMIQAIMPLMIIMMMMGMMGGMFGDSPTSPSTPKKGSGEPWLAKRLGDKMRGEVTAGKDYAQLAEEAKKLGYVDESEELLGIAAEESAHRKKLRGILIGIKGEY